MRAYQQKPYLHVQNEALIKILESFATFAFQVSFREAVNWGATGGTTTPQVSEVLLQISWWHQRHLKTMKEATLFLHKDFSYPFGHINLSILGNITVVGFGLTDPISSLPNCVILSPNWVLKSPQGQESGHTPLCNLWGPGMSPQDFLVELETLLPNFSLEYIYTCFPVTNCSITRTPE